MNQFVDILTAASKLIWPLSVAVAIATLYLSVKTLLNNPTQMLRRKNSPSGEDFEFGEFLSGRLSTQKAAEEVIEQKRQAILKIPNISFHYAHKERVENFYNDYFKEPTIEKIVNEIANETSGSIKGKLPQVLETKIGGKDVSRWISTLKLPDTSLNGMFLRYQRETIKNNQVALGLDVIDVELSILEEFDELVTRIQNDFGLVVDANQIEAQRTKLKEKAAERTLIKLEKASGAVLVEGLFRITEAGIFYKCVYSHPVSEYMHADHPVTISVLIQKNSIEPHVAGNYAQSIGQTVPLHVYGDVWQPVSRVDNKYEFCITPLAVY